jgi:predicted ATPase/Tfp pilus assembly protein PilF
MDVAFWAIIAGLIGTAVAIMVGLTQLVEFIQKQREKKRTKPSSDTLPPPQPSAPTVLPKEPSTNLPAEVTPLIGRKQESAAVQALLQRTDVRLVTLVGPPGAGKTRLGLKVAASVADEFQDEVFFVALAPVRDVALVVPTIAQMLKVKEVANQPLMETLKNHLQDKQMLLLLDNFEQVMPAASLISELLAAAPELKVLVTSREGLSLSGEHEYMVPPLALPDLRHLSTVDDLMQFPSVELFVQRARAVKPDFQLTKENGSAIAELCDKLDGLPLAIELAAARSKLLLPGEMLARLESRFTWLTSGAKDLPVHQQTLQGALDWSYQLLELEEQMLFRRLGVFMSGCSLEAIGAVCGDSLRIDVLEGIASLVDKSLVQRKDGPARESRFMMLETIREYAFGQVEKAGEEKVVRDLHLVYFLQLAEQAEPELHGARQVTWLRHLDLENGNLRAALTWSMQNRAETGLRLAGALNEFWQARGYLREGREWLRKALAQGGGASAVTRAKALNAAGMLAWRQGDYAAARPLYEQCIALRAKAGNYAPIAAALVNLADMLIDDGDIEAASPLLKASQTMYQTLGDRQGTAATLGALGAAALSRSDYPVARQHYQEAITIAQEGGNQLRRMHWIRRLADIAWHQGDFAAARAQFQEALRVGRESRDMGHTTSALTSLGYLACDEGNYEAARALFEEALAMRREIGDKRGTAITLNGLGDVASRLGNATLAHALYMESLEVKREIGDKVGIAIALNNLGKLASEQEDYPLAHSLLSQSLDLFSDLQNRRGVALSLRNLAKLAAAQGEWQKAVELYKTSLKTFWEIGAKRDIAVCFEGLADSAVVHKQFERATHLFASAETLRNSIGLPLPPSDQPLYQENVTTLRQHMGESAYAEIWAAAQTVPLDLAVAYAVSDSNTDPSIGKEQLP